MIPTAKQMAEAIRINTEKLVRAEILEVESMSAAQALASDLLRQEKLGDGWAITVDREYPFAFRTLITDGGIIFRPVVSVDRIVIDSKLDEGFQHLDIALQLACVENKYHARWHFDKANLKGKGQYQDGPLYHLQFGGHVPNQANDFWLKEPRWAHAPMDLILLLEAVAANFYTDEWTEKIRRDPTWCEYVSQSERMCLSVYLEKIQKFLNIRSDTVLSGLWANA
ncbi:hypothetical protein [Stenotrophomonas sp. Iso1]|uniref:hypothetical protein n=1 Tax=Stenotrophomonas sp. Iso1 TaxID=2977283 RepID=UPI0022B783D6|nr:hypothetical protein [Stenotrophomonas sp. Iso1]